jgi:hypothetical protein
VLYGCTLKLSAPGWQVQLLYVNSFTVLRCHSRCCVQMLVAARTSGTHSVVSCIRYEVQLRHAEGASGCDATGHRGGPAVPALCSSCAKHSCAGALARRVIRQALVCSAASMRVPHTVVMNMKPSLQTCTRFILHHQPCLGLCRFYHDLEGPEFKVKCLAYAVRMRCTMRFAALLPTCVSSGPQSHGKLRGALL